VGIVLCVGLACVAHADGVLRLWPLLGVGGGAPVQQAGTLRAHRSGLRGCCLVDADALGGEAAGGIAGGGIVTSGRFGSLALWPHGPAPNGYRRPLPMRALRTFF
jgi:hypothetical protein